MRFGPRMWILLLFLVAQEGVEATALHSRAYRCCVGQPLDVGLFPMDVPPWWNYNNATVMHFLFRPHVLRAGGCHMTRNVCQGTHSGFVVDVLTWLASETGLNVNVKSATTGYNDPPTRALEPITDPTLGIVNQPAMDMTLAAWPAPR